MEKKLFVIVFIIFAFCLIAMNDQGLTVKIIEPESSEVSGRAKEYSPVPKTKQKTSSNPQFSRDEWELIDSLRINSFIQEGKYKGVYFDFLSSSFVEASNHDNLIAESRLALLKSPVWLRAELENTLSHLSDSDQLIWAGAINDSYDPYTDEIAFSIANSSYKFLESEYSNPQLFYENAELIYDIDGDLDYVEIIDYGTSNSDENYYSTTRYWKRDSNGVLSQVEVPKEIYYWYLVHPKITDEIPAYIDPDIVESNSTHHNNIIDPPVGVFWRNFLYNHNDEGYPKLRYYLEAVDIVWDGSSLSDENAVGATNKWIAESMVFTSNAERPHQPVRIYRKHIGRCGEHADLRAAVLRIGLIPATSILTISTDHTWNEFWDEEWIHYDGGSVNNPLLYENGWGKVHASVFEIRSDGVLTAVSDTYSEGSAQITIYVHDPEGDPVDGARIILGMLDGTTIRSDMVGFTDREGKYEFVVGEGRTYYAKMTSDLGNDPMDGSYALLVESIEDGSEHTFLMDTPQSLNSIVHADTAEPADDIDDYKIVVNFEVAKQVIHGRVVFDDLNQTEFYHCIDDGATNFFMTDLIQYSNYIAGLPFEIFDSFPSSAEGFSDFDVPMDNWWYAFFDNYCSLNNPEMVVGSIALYRYDDNGGSGMISGTISDAFDSGALENAVITAGVFQTTTDENGNYSLDVYPQVYDVTCSIIGYETALTEDISVGNGAEVVLDLDLFETALMPQNVLVIENVAGYSEISWNEPVRLREYKNSNYRDFEGYYLYRGMCDQDDFVENWIIVAEDISETNYLDTEWENLENGTYKYAVEAVYSNENISPKAYSNDIYKGMTSTVTMTITTNSGDNPNGAVVYLTNLDDHPLHNYSAIATEDGMIEFDEVWLGIYELSVELDNFEIYSLDSLAVNNDEFLEITLNELITAVSGISVIDYLCSWIAVPTDRSFIEYHVYLDDLNNPISSTINQFYDFSGLDNGLHTVGISANYTTGESNLSILEFEHGSSLSTNIIAYYPFNGNFNDESGNDYHGNMVGDITFIEDVISGQSAVFDETDEYIDCPGIFAEAPESFTVSWWLNPASHTNWNQQMRSPGGWGSFVFHSTNEGSFYVGTDVNSRLNPSYFTESLILDEWQLLTFSYENGLGRMFRNGHEMASKFGMNDPIAWNGFWIGTDGSSTIDGHVDEVRIWERAIGTAEIEYFYSQNVPFWGMIEGTVVSAIDQTPIQGASIRAGMFDTTTDENGNYSLDVGATTYRVFCFYENFDEELQEGIVVGDGETVSVNFEYGFTGLEEEFTEAIPTVLHNYPNPFQSTTTISFNLAIGNRGKNTEISIFNIKGQKIKTYPNIEMNKSADQQIIWDGTDEYNKPVSSGIYFCKLISGARLFSKKMILMR